MELNKPTLIRLCRQAGIKSVSEDCYAYIRGLIVQRLERVLNATAIVNDEHQTKIIMLDDLYEALKLLGENLARSTDLGTKTVGK